MLHAPVRGKRGQVTGISAISVKFSPNMQLGLSAGPKGTQQEVKAVAVRSGINNAPMTVRVARPHRVLQTVRSLPYERMARHPIHPPP